MADPDTAVGFLLGEILNSALHCLVDAAKYRFRCLLLFNEFVVGLRAEKEKLLRNRESILKSVEEAIDKTKEIDVVVKQWLLNADILMREVEKLEEKAAPTKNVLGCCPHFGQIRLAGLITEKTTILQKILCALRAQNWLLTSLWRHWKITGSVRLKPMAWVDAVKLHW